jgi:hypothetical protein
VGFSDVMPAGSAPASCVLPTAASQRIHYPYPLYLVFWSCFLRRIQGVSKALSADQNISVARFFWLISSESYLASSQSFFPIANTTRCIFFFCTSRSPISENPFHQRHQR